MYNSIQNKMYIESLEVNPKITILSYDKTLLTLGKNKSIWYDTDVIAFRYNHRYSYYCNVSGIVELYYKPTKDHIISYGNNAEKIRYFLEKYELTSDSLIETAEKRGTLIIKQRNHYVDELYDNVKEKWFIRDASIGPLGITNEYIEDLIKQGKEYMEKKIDIKILIS